MTDTTALIAEARQALATMATAATTVAATLDGAEQRIAELEAGARQSAAYALAVADGQSGKAESRQAKSKVRQAKTERKPRPTRQRSSRGQTEQKAREAIAGLIGPWTAKDLAKAAGLKDVTAAYRYIRQFEAAGLIREAGKVAGTKSYMTSAQVADIEGNGSGDEMQVEALA